MKFKPLNYFESVRVHRKKLPHWRQPGVTYFVTGRLADSVPQHVLDEWLKAKDQWLKERGIESSDQLENANEELRKEYHRMFTARFHELLDAGHGECVLRLPEIAGIVSGLFVKSHGTTCTLGAWVIMPNHFHALVTPLEGAALGVTTQKWKGSSSRQINLCLGRQGRLWQAEGFDHVVRSEQQLNHFRRYIAENPVKAGLRDGWVLGIGAEVGMTVEQMKQRFELE